jgi:hypothetical protein
MKPFLILTIAFLYTTAYSQTVDNEAILNAAGNHKIEGYAQISWTLGDFEIRTFRKEAIIITQGFLQSRMDLNGPNTIDITLNEFQLKCYPNPVKELLQVEIQKKNPEQLFYSLFSLEGKLIHKSIITNSTSKIAIDFSQFTYGMYILNFSTENNRLIKSFKILYQE